MTTHSSGHDLTLHVWSTARRRNDLLRSRTGMVFRSHGIPRKTTHVVCSDLRPVSPNMERWLEKPRVTEHWCRVVAHLCVRLCVVLSRSLEHDNGPRTQRKRNERTPKSAITKLRVIMKCLEHLAHDLHLGTWHGFFGRHVLYVLKVRHARAHGRDAVKTHESRSHQSVDPPAFHDCPSPRKCTAFATG